MQLRLRWIDAFVGHADPGGAAWQIVRADRRVELRAEIAQLNAGELVHRLEVRRRIFGGEWSVVPVQPSVSGDHRERLDLAFSLAAPDIGISAQTFAVRKLRLSATLLGANGEVRERVAADAYAMPDTQFQVTRWVRVFAFLPLVLLLWAWSAGEMSDDIAAWYGAINLLVGLIVQEQPLARFSSVLRAATRGVLPALLLMFALVFAQRLLLVRIDNQTESQVLAPGLQLEPGHAAITWRWRAPTERTLEVSTEGWNSYTVEARGTEWELSKWPGAFWKTNVVCCKPFWLDCSLADHPKACDQRARCLDPLTSDSRVETSDLGEPVELGPSCTIPRLTRKSRSIAVVLGRDGPTSPKRADAPPDRELACDGQYDLLLSERAAYSGNRRARADYADSFAMLTLSDTLHGIELLWKSTEPDSGFLSVVAKTPASGQPSCKVMIPIRSGSFEVELREIGVLGTVRCPSRGSCEQGYTIEPAYALRGAAFDGLTSYAVDHGRSLWSPLGGAMQGFVCGCLEKTGQAAQPKQATLQFSRPPPLRLRLAFEGAKTPVGLDLAVQAQHSMLRCLLPSSTPSIDIQPIQLSFTRSGRHVEVGQKDGPWHSEWTWLEGDHRAWSCVPGLQTSSETHIARATPEFQLRVDGGRTYPYVRDEDGDAPELPTCYLHPRSGEVALSLDRFEREKLHCDRWEDARPEYASLVRSKHVCGSVKRCQTR